VTFVFEDYVGKTYRKTNKKSGKEGETSRKFDLTLFVPSYFLFFSDFVFVLFSQIHLIIVLLPK